MCECTHELCLGTAFLLFQACFLYCRLTDGCQKSGSLLEEATDLPFPPDPLHALCLPHSFCQQEHLRGNWFRELDDVVVDLTHSRALLIPFFLDNSAVCSGPTKASRKWWIWGEREWLGHMHNHSKTNFLAVKGSLCVCLQVSRKQVTDWRKESPFVPVPRNQCGTSCYLLKQFTWQTATVNECSSCM